MYTWVIYDIRKNKVRSEVSKMCKRVGLQRVQKSVFLGKTSKHLLKRFRTHAMQALNLKTDILFIVPMTKGAYKRTIQLGQGFDKQNLGKMSLLHFI